MRVGARRKILTSAVLLTTLASLGFLAWNWIQGSTTTIAGSNATMDGLMVDVRPAVWAPMDHAEGDDHAEDEQGYGMPDQMMPGGPTGGDVRLGVGVTLTNTQSAAAEFSLPEEFTMIGGLETEPQPLSADTVGEVGRLGPGSALEATLYFDVQVTEDGGSPSLYLVWSRGRDEVRIPVPLPGDEVPGHQH